MAWIVKNVAFRTLEISSRRLSLHNCHRDTDSPARLITPSLNQTKVRRRRLADRVHLPDRRARHAADLCQRVAHGPFVCEP